MNSDSPRFRFGQLCLRSHQADREGGAGPPGEGVCVRTGIIKYVKCLKFTSCTVLCQV